MREGGYDPSVSSFLRSMSCALFVTSIVTCAPSTLLRAVEQGRYDAVKVELQTRSLSQGDLHDLARAIAEHELHVAKAGDRLDRVSELAPCVRELDELFSIVMQTHDDAGARAAMARVTAGTLMAADARASPTDLNVHWRAVGVASLVGVEDGWQRREALLDPNVDVRKAALWAAEQVHDAKDAPALVDVARKDPEIFVRVQAVRTLERFPVLTDDVALALRDESGDAKEPVRRQVAVLWAKAALRSADVRNFLYALIAGKMDLAALEGALAVLRLSRVHEPHLVEISRARVAQTLLHGTRFERLAILTSAPVETDPDFERALLDLKDAQDAEVRVAALERMLYVPAQRAMAALALEAIAAQVENPFALRATLALIQAKEEHAPAAFEKLATAGHVQDKEALARGGLALKSYERAALLLTDTSPSVRTRVACLILRASE